MAYIIFNKNSDNIEGTLYKIAENDSDLSQFNFSLSDYKVIQVSNEDFNNVKLYIKTTLKYDGDIITYKNLTISFNNFNNLLIDINDKKRLINDFLKFNPNHPQFNRWNNYLTQLNNLNFNGITYPLNMSFEKYLNDLSQPVLNILQLP